MPISAKCDCGHRFSAGDREGGRRRQCPACGELVTIPHLVRFDIEPESAPPAGWSWRALAFLLDGVFVAVGIVTAILLTGVEIPTEWDGQSPLPEALAWVILGAVVLPPLLTATMMSLTNGRTPGKMWAGIRVECADGTPIGFWQAWGREMLKSVFTSAGQATGFLIPAINYLWPLTDERSRAVHDIICGTRVVDTDLDGIVSDEPEPDDDDY